MRIFDEILQQTIVIVADGVYIDLISFQDLCKCFLGLRPVVFCTVGFCRVKYFPGFR